MILHVHVKLDFSLVQSVVPCCLIFVSCFCIPEEIGIDSPDEREVILSEIYRRFHPEEEDMFEMEIQGN